MSTTYSESVDELNSDCWNQ